MILKLIGCFLGAIFLAALGACLATYLAAFDFDYSEALLLYLSLASIIMTLFGGIGAFAVILIALYLAARRIVKRH